MRPRSIRSIIAASAFLLLAPHPLHGQPSDRIAVLTELEGTVTLARAGSDAFGETNGFGTALYASDRIRTGDGASASILYSNGDLLSVGSNRSITISNPEGGVEGGASRVEVDTRAASSAASLALHRSGEGEIAALSGLRSDGNRAVISALSPSNSAIRSERPTFSWSTDAPFTMYRVRVFTSDGVVWEGETGDTSVRYPDDAPALEPGVDYLWQVIGEDMLDAERSEVSRVRLLAPESISAIAEAEVNLAELKSGSMGSGNYHLLLGSMYAEAGLLEDAAVAFAALAERHPNSTLPRALLAQVYAEMGRTDLALNALKAAAALPR